MASIFNCSVVSTIRASSESSRKSYQNRAKTQSTTWWAPLFGWSSDPDYVTTDARSNPQSESPNSEPQVDRPRSKFSLGGFTEEKAKQLRKKTAESSSFHDIMYHSAIASRLASDLSEK
ncbi:uncharacterized protein [Euphorbia lathyris]|uniref:uncharacterized protein n=1 Tax=Euphorbia lathyris TaxID=212925 RepID=UPI003313BE11